MAYKICDHCGAGFIAKLPAAKLCFACWRKREAAFAQWDGLSSYARSLEKELEEASAPAIPAPMLAKLILLCHPDRHGNSPLSNEVTIWLLGQREAPI